MLRITIDTNVRRDLVDEACAGLNVEIRPTTVTLREQGLSLPAEQPFVAETGVYGESRYDSGAVYGVVHETAVIGEWRIGMAVAGSADSPLEAILRIIGDGSFPPPGQRENLTKGERNQLGDAMILEAHTREGRDVLVSNDTTAFVKHGRRARLEELCRTKILTVEEFCAQVASLVPAADH